MKITLRANIIFWLLCAFMCFVVEVDVSEVFKLNILMQCIFFSRDLG